ncbi:MAG: glycosyltransferase family 4 protein [Candidatus Omnitrophota bacterium]
MKIIKIVPGTGNFYCGSCIRDTALVRALRRLDHEAVLQPLYLPLCSDESISDSGDRIFFGGVNVFLQQKADFFQKTPRWFDRIFDSRWLLQLSSRQAGMTKASELGEMTLSMLAGEEGRQVKELRRFIEWLKQEEKPDAVILSNALLLGLSKSISQVLGLPLLCTLQGEDGFLDALTEPYRTAAWRQLESKVKYVDMFIPVSFYYNGVMKQRLNIPAEKCAVVQNGISLDGYRERAEEIKTPTIGFLARLCAAKGLDRLIEVFIHLKKHPEFHSLRLKIAGVMTSGDKPFVKEMKKLLDKAGVLPDASFHPNIAREEKIEFLNTLSVLSVPATYGEAFGLYAIEAMAAGVPVVQPQHGGFTEIVETSGGGVLYDPNESGAYESALAEILLNPGKAREMGRLGKKAVRDHFNVDRMAREILKIIENLPRSKP